MKRLIIFGGFNWRVKATQGFLLAIICFFSGCSTEKRTFPYRHWHNLLAHYNGYFLGREKMKEADAAVAKGHVDNYNRILEIFPVVTPAIETSIAPMLTEAIKKASIPIQRHKNSDWVDDSYLVIGRARVYKKEDYENALYTFRYINSKSTDLDMKHTSLIWLMRTYTLGNNFNDAYIVDDYLRKQKMNRANLRAYFVVKAYYHYKQKEYKEVADNLEQALKLMFFPSETRARYHYIVAQIRQREGRDSSAYQHYKYCIRNNPPYEMSFHAKTNIGQVTSLDDDAAVRKVNRYFKKLLKDEKNAEYKDRIYYEMARFELKQNHVDKAVTLFKTSVKEKKSKPNQKAYGYLRLAEVNYDRLKNYVEAKNYYDSSLAILDTLDESYPLVKRRAKYLTEFVKEYLVIVREDSLQKVAAMDSTTRNKHIDKLIAAADEKAEAKRKAARKLAKAAADLGGGYGKDSAGFKTPDPAKAAGDGADNTWYFSNPIAMEAGKIQFKKKFGSRPLEDHWRRSTKEAQEPDPSAPKDSTAKQGGAKPELAKKDSSKLGDALADGDEESVGSAKKKKDKGKNSEAEKRKKYLADLPMTKDALKASNDKLKVALFNIGKIYDQKLEEPKNAEQSFLRVVNGYPDYEKTPEALYNLYLMYGKQGRESDKKAVADRLVNNYPESIYAKLIKNPNYLKELKAANEASEQLYKQAYAEFEAGQYVETQQTIATIRSRFPENDYKDKLDLLDVHVLGKTLDYATYKKGLQDFMAKWPKSKLYPHAKFMLETAEAFLKKQNAPAADTTPAPAAGQPTIYSPKMEQPHYFILALPIDKVDQNAVQTKLGEFNGLYYPEETFTMGNILLGDGKHILISVKEFKTQVLALNYLKKHYDDSGLLNMLKNVKYEMFVISQENYPKFYKAKNLKDYMDFFNKHYDLSEL